MSDNPSPSTSGTNSPESAPAKRNNPTKVLPSERLSLEKQVSTLRAFAAAYSSNGGKPVTNDEAAAIIGIAGNTAVVTNPFFTDMGLLFRQKDGDGFTPSPDVMAYFKAHEWNPETSKEKLRGVFEKAWFSTALVPRLKFRAYDTKEALAVLAEASNASKDHESRIERLLEFMSYFGVVARDGTQVKSATNSSAGISPPETPATPNTLPPALPPQPPADAVEEGLFKSVLPLDASSKRRLVVWAPPTITTKELDRIKNWLSVQIIVDDAT